MKLADDLRPDAPVSGLVTSEDYWQALRIMDKSFKLIPLRLNRIQLHYQSNRALRNLILKPRQVGFSTFIQADTFVAAQTETIAGATLAHDAITTTNLRTMATRFYDNLPDHLRRPRGFDSAVKTTYPHTHSEIVIATAGSLNVGRGFTLSRVHGSEVAYWRDAAYIISGLMQAVPLHGLIEFESTANGAQGLFHEKCMAALDGDSEFKLHFYAWWWDSSYAIALDPDEIPTYADDELALVQQHGLTPEQIKWRRAKQRELPNTFFQEYPEDALTCFLTSGNSYFGDVSKCFTAPLDSTPQDGARYIGGLDFGQSNDYTVLVILDQFAKRMVHIERIRQQSWQDIRAIITREARRWNATIYAESNSIGSVNIEQLRNDGIHIIPFATTAQSKPPLIQGLKYALTEAGLILQPHAALKAELQTFISEQSANGAWQYHAQKDAHDDTVMALALAWYGCSSGRLSMPIFIR